MKRREFIAGLGGAAAWPLAARATKAQGASQMPHIGWLWPGRSGGNPEELAGFKQGLWELGFVEGKNLTVAYGFGENNMEHLADVAADIARMKVTVVLALGVDAVKAAQRAAPDTPVVFFTGEEFRADSGLIGGLVTNLSRPGGNLTGLSLMRLGGKWPELAKEAMPMVSRVGYLFNPNNVSSVKTRDDARRSAEALGMSFSTYPVERPEELEDIFAAMSKDAVGVVMLDATHPYPTDWPRVASLALKYGLPSVSETRAFVAVGGLMSYGTNIFDVARRMAYYMDKVLKGTKPGDLPVEQPTKFELWINLKTAKALGLTIPASFLLRADEVIE